jgi:hypothetical protein
MHTGGMKFTAGLRHEDPLPVVHALLQGFAGLGRSGAVVEVAIALADLYLGVARCIVFVFAFTRGALNVALFEALLVLLQSIVEYHAAPPSVPALRRVHLPGAISQLGFPWAISETIISFPVGTTEHHAKKNQPKCLADNFP